MTTSSPYLTPNLRLLMRAHWRVPPALPGSCSYLQPKAVVYILCVCTRVCVSLYVGKVILCLMPSDFYLAVSYLS